MRSYHLRLDLSLLRQGLTLGWEFGVRPLEEMTRIAEIIQHSVYEAGSLRSAPGGVEFVLRNPPLRVGLFSAVRVFWDGRQLPADRVGLTSAGSAETRLDQVDRSRPIAIPVGVRSRFHCRIDAPGVGHSHAVRLELQSIAIPPLVWFDFSDVLGPERPR